MIQIHFKSGSRVTVSLEFAYMKRIMSEQKYLSILDDSGNELYILVSEISHLIGLKD